ncbi:hypothetical protein GGS24DRAFT_517038 [Hypoxylon argillaceum]|nr:hypothetical protein GGS24DRAFT_517038 [Hypoxylon argillaceum]
MSTQARIHWLAPALMVGAWLGGILVASGHHIYYSRLDGSAVDVDQQILGMHLTSQQFTNTAGTALAFVTRALLILATSKAFAQIFWRAARNPTRLNTLGDLDTMFSGLSDLLGFRNVSTWWKHPLLLLVALTSWLLPIAFIIPPGTLSVIVVLNTSSVQQNVPNVDFFSFNQVADIPSGANVRGFGHAYRSYIYNGPSPAVEKVAAAITAQGEILPIKPPAENSSWSLDFYGPSLTCGPMDDNVQAQVEPNIAGWLWDYSGSNPGEANCWDQASTYLCWNPTPYNALTNRSTTLLPFISTAYGDFSHFSPLASNETQFSKGAKQGPFTPLYMASLPSVAQSPCAPLNSGKPPFTQVENAGFFQCDLYNASYHAEFDYKSGVQNITYTVDRLEAVTTVYEMLGPDAGGTTDDGDFTCDRLVEELPPSGVDPCIFDLDLLQRLSYTGVLDAFAQVVRGSVSMDSLSGAEVDTNIFSTSLIDTTELQYLTSVNVDNQTPTLQGVFMANNQSQGRALSNVAQGQSRSSLPRVMEELFGNLTISLMSSDLLQPNLSSVFSPPPANVTFTTLKSVYSYSPANLWIAYGSAILAAALALVAGFVALLSNSASYSNDFSTILRAAYGTKLVGIFMQHEDVSGAAPLPKYLEGAQVEWHSPEDYNAVIVTNPETSAENEYHGEKNLAGHGEFDLRHGGTTSLQGMHAEYPTARSPSDYEGHNSTGYRMNDDEFDRIQPTLPPGYASVPSADDFHRS